MEPENTSLMQHKRSVDLSVQHVAIEEAINGMAFANAQGIIHYVNKAFLRLWSISRAEEATGMTIGDLFTSSTDIVCQVKELGSYEGELLALRADQSVFTAMLSARMVTDRESEQIILLSVMDVTPQKRAETKFKESQLLFNSVLEALPVGVYLVDKTGKSLYGNRQIREIWGGMSVGESLEDDYRKYAVRRAESGKTLDLHESGIYKALAGGETTLKEHLELQMPDGSNRIVKCSSAPIRNEKNEVLGGLVVLEDITQEKLSQWLLEKNSRDYQEIVDAIDQSSLVSITDLNGTILKVNRRFCEVAGYDAEELVGQNHNIVSSGYHDKTFWKAFWQTITRGEVWRGEIKNKTKHGTTYWVDTVVNPIHDEQGKVTHYFSIRQDITSRKIYESLLEAKNTELTGIIDALDESSLVSITDLSGTILKVNKRFCQVSRYEEEELLGKNHSVISSGYHGKGFWSNFWKTINQGEVWRGEIKNRAKDGTEYWVDTVINPMRNEFGRITHFLSIRQDITDRKRYETLLLKSNLRLEQIEQFVDLTTDSILVTDSSGQLVYINKVAAGRLGITQEECGQYNVVDFEVQFKARSNWKETVERLKTTDSANGERTYFNLRTGEIFPVDVTARYVEIQGKGFLIAVARDITERKKGEMELRESRERLAEAQRIARLGYWEHNLVTNTIWWSDMQCEIFGLQRSELPKTNDDFVKLIHPDDRKKFARILSGKLSDSLQDYRIVRPDGKVRVVHAVAQITCNEAGVPIMLSGVNQDVTDRILVEQALRESEQTLKRAQQIAKIGTWKLDLLHNVLEWSDETYKIFGVTLEKRPLTSENFFESIHPEDKDHVYNTWRKSVESRQDTYEAVHRILLGNTIKWVAQHAEFTYESDQAVFAFGTVQDITDQMFLRNTNIIFNQSQSLAGIGSWRYTIKSNELFWSDSVYSLFGKDKNTTQATNEVYLNAIHPDDRPYINVANTNIHSNREPFEMEYRVMLPDGRIRWIYEKGNVLADSNGVPVEMYGIVREITSEKIKTEELIKARRQAEEASTIKDEFLSVMSHEIRTPLNSVIGLSNLLLKRTPREDQLQIMKTLKGSADNLLHLVNDILDYNKIRAGKVELEILSFSMTEFLQHLHASYSLSSQEKGIDFIIQADPLVPEFLMGDVGRMNQIFNNLLNNAIKFTSKGFVKFTVELMGHHGDACTVLFRVEDSGVGIAADKLDMIFNPFQQSERSISRKYGGTGLGLSIVKTLVEIMNGKMSLKSKVGEGSVFTLEFEFPLSRTEEHHHRNEPVPVPTVVQNESHQPVSRGLNVLYVEDVESNRFLIKSLLADHQIACRTASSGLAALRLTKKIKYDLILMDIQMPKMDGYQATEKIRNQQGGKNRKTPVIAFTAEPYSDALKKKSMDHRIQDVITKPFDPDKLIAKINTLTTPAPPYFSFAFYERTFGQDLKMLKSIRKTVIKDFRKFEVNMGKFHLARNVKGIRSEIHKMRPIVKNLECQPLYAILDQYKWPETYTREAAVTTREIIKLTNRLLNGLEKLNW